MKTKIIKSWVIALLFTLILSTTTLADGGGTKIEKNVDGIKIDLILNGDTINIGSNTLIIKLYDKKGRPLEDANVKVTADMPGNNMNNMNMNNSKPDTIDFKAGHEKGEYTGSLNFSDKGDWRIKANFTTGSQEKMADFDVKVVSSGPNWFVIGGFLAVVVLIIIIAGISKNKKKASVA